MGTAANPTIPRRGEFQDTPPPPPGGVPPVSKARSIGTRVLLLTSLAFFIAAGVTANQFLNTAKVSEEGTELISKAMDLEGTGKLEDAIATYEKFLKQMDEEDVPHTNINYMNAATRIAELYERLKRPDKALKIYQLLAKHSLETVTEWEVESLLSDKSLFELAINRSLTLAIKCATMSPKEQADEAKELLLLNIVQAQRRIMDEYPPLISVLNQSTNQSVMALIAHDVEQRISGASDQQREQRLSDAMKHPLELPIYTTDETEENKLLGMYVKGWPPFTRTLINARDVYANMCISDGDYVEAASSLATNSAVIQKCFDHPARLTICLTKLAIVLQMLAESLSDKLDTEQKQAALAETPMSVPSMPTQFDLSLDKLDTRKLLTSAVQMQSPQLKEYMIRKTYHESESIFRRTLLLTSKMKKQNMQRDVNQLFKPALDRSEMVSSCGLALIGYQNGHNQDALKYLQRASVLARKLNEKDYLDDITKWMEMIEHSS